MAYEVSSGNYFTVARNYNVAEFSVSLWVYRTTSGVQRSVAGLWQDTGSLYQWLINQNTSNQITWTIHDGANRDVTGAVISLNVWTHIAMVKSTTNLYGYINGTRYGPTASTSSITSRASSFGIGARQNGTVPYVGNLAEFATWTRALTDAEVTSLSKGFKPIRVPTPEIYIPLVRDTTDIRSGYTVTQVGTPVVQPHPRVY